MADASLDPRHSELVRLRLRVGELESELARMRPSTSFVAHAGGDCFHRLIEEGPFIHWEAELEDFCFTSVGPGAEALLGFPREDWYAADFWERHLHPEDRGAALELREEAIAQGRDRTFEYRMVAGDGRIVHVLDMIHVLCIDGKPIRICGLMLDVTEARKEEEKRQQARKQEALGVLAGGMAHNFNNLLTSILGYTELAERDIPEGMAARGYLSEVIKAAHRAAALTQQILAYAGKGRFILQLVDLSSLVLQMSPQLHTLVSDKAALRLECPPGLPVIEADVAQIRQLVLHLATNAFEALDDHRGTVVVRTALRCLEPPVPDARYASDDAKPGPYVCLEVTDTGCGMSEEVLARIFDPFFTTRFTGRGLGLAAVLGMVRAHQGLLRVSSTPGQGSTFEVLFPALQQEAPITS